MWRALRLVLLAAALTACTSGKPDFRSSVLPPVEWGHDFTLTAQDGKRLDTASFHGKVQVLFFGFTHCPDICAPTLARLAQVQKSLGDDAARVQVLFVSVDGERDTPEQLRKFLAGFNPAFMGFTGSVSELQAVARDYHIFAEADGGSITHTGSIFVKDRSGRLRLVMNESHSIDDMAHDLRLLVRE